MLFELWKNPIQYINHIFCQKPSTSLWKREPLSTWQNPLNVFDLLPFLVGKVSEFWKIWEIKGYYLDPDSGNFLEPFNDQCSHHIETSHLICSANQLTGFYMMRTLVVKRVKKRKFDRKLSQTFDEYQRLNFCNCERIQEKDKLAFQKCWME